uniref:Uncharacterized protein n=1 Tax=Trichuris muris TaxID=70415 RepID=A0A5S6Q6G0_TRIMR
MPATKILRRKARKNSAAAHPRRQANIPLGNTGWASLENAHLPIDSAKIRRSPEARICWQIQMCQTSFIPTSSIGAVDGSTPYLVAQGEVASLDGSQSPVWAQRCTYERDTLDSTFVTSERASLVSADFLTAARLATADAQRCLGVSLTLAIVVDARSSSRLAAFAERRLESNLPYQIRVASGARLLPTLRRPFALAAHATGS